MTERDIRFGFNGEGRDIGYGDGKKVHVGAITSAYYVDATSICECEQVFDSNQYKGFMPRPGPRGYELFAGEMAFTVRGSGGRVRTAINGLDARFAELYPDNAELVRQLLEEVIEPIGAVTEDPMKMVNGESMVTLFVGGTHPFGAPSVYNFGYADNMKQATSPHIIAGSQVCFVPPNLKHPVQFGNPASGVPAGKVRLVARAADKRSTASRIITMIGELNRNPEKLKAALRDHAGVAHTWMRIGKAVVQSYETALLLGLNVLLKRNIIQIVGAPTAAGAAPVTELLQPVPVGGGVAEALASEDTVVRMAEFIGLINAHNSTSAAALGPDDRAKWKTIEYELRNTMLPAPNPTTQKYNAAYQFGFVVNKNDGTYASKARVDGRGAIRDNAMGKFFQKSLNHWREFLEALTGGVYHEQRKSMGVALTEPSVRGESRFQMLLMPHGGLSDMN